MGANGAKISRECFLKIPKLLIFQKANHSTEDLGTSEEESLYFLVFTKAALTLIKSPKPEPQDVIAIFSYTPMIRSTLQRWRSSQAEQTFCMMTNLAASLSWESNPQVRSSSSLNTHFYNKNNRINLRFILKNNLKISQISTTIFL